MFSPQLNETIVKFFGAHGPDGLLAFIIFTLTLSAVGMGAPPYLSIFFALAIYVLYVWRRNSDQGHQERMAENDVAKTALALKRFQAGQLARLEREKLKALPKIQRARHKND